MWTVLFALLCFPSDPAYVLADVRLFDGTGRSVVEHASLVVREGKIERVLGAGEPPPASIRVLREYAGKTVIPGLIDAHVHAWSELDAVFLANGVTTLRDLGGEEQSSLARRAQSFESDEHPRTYVCGPIFDGSPPVWPFSVTPKTPEEARSEVDRLVRAGIDAVKVYTKLQEPIWRALIAAAHEHHRKAIGHVPLGLTARDAVHAGQDEIEHLEGVAETCVDASLRPKSVSDYLRRESEVWEAADRECFEALAAEMAEAGTVSCPTLVVLERLSRAGSSDLADDPNLASVSPKIRAWWDGQFASFAGPAGVEYRKHASAAFERRLEFVRLLHESGAPIIVGSDTPNPYVVPGFAVHDELALLVRAGLEPADALLAATSQAARAIGCDGELGSIAPGKIADLVILDRDPLADIAATRSILAVVHRGRIWSRDELAAQLPGAPPPSTVSEAAATQQVAPPADAPENGKLLYEVEYATTFAKQPAGSESAKIFQRDGGGLVIEAHLTAMWPSDATLSFQVVCGASGALESATIVRLLGHAKSIARYRVTDGRVLGELTAADGKSDAIELSADRAVALSGQSMALGFARARIEHEPHLDLIVDTESLRASIAPGKDGVVAGEPATLELPIGKVTGRREKLQGSGAPTEVFVASSGLPLALRMEMPTGLLEIQCTRLLQP